MTFCRSEIALIAAVALASCGKAEAPAPSHAPSKASAEIICTYAPSQSAIVANLGSAAGGVAATTSALAQALGLSVVTHSSGALILTGSGGYIAGTIGAAAAGPVVVGIGVIAAGSAGTVELLCVPKNHPETVAKVEAAANEFAARSKVFVSNTSKTVIDFIAERRIALLKSGEEAIAFANRKSVEISEAPKGK